jgi:thiopeptide-type bacteriocin biosynthesis protein
VTKHRAEDANAFKTAGFFALRTPVLPWNVIEELSRNLTAAGALEGEHDLDAALAHDARRVRERLRAIVRRPEVRGALRVASSSLDARLQPWLDGEETAEACSVEGAVLRYVVRMAGRSTPFGLFAGGGMGTVGGRTDLAVPPLAKLVRRTCVTLDAVFVLAMRLSADAALRPHLRFRLNESVLESAGRLRYFTVRLRGGSRAYQSAEVVRTDPLDRAVEAARSHAGGATLEEIARAVVAGTDDVTLAEALEYAESLVESQLLSSPLLPAVTGPDPMLRLIEELRKLRLPEASRVADGLQATLDYTSRRDAEGVVVARPGDEEALAAIHALFEDVDPTRLLQVDLHKPCAGVTLGKAVANEIARGAELLAAMTPRRESRIDRFARSFEERYQGREVPLLEALDAELGIGFDSGSPALSDPSPLLEGITLETPHDSTATWGAREDLLLGKLSEALRQGANEISLSAADVRALSDASPDRLPAGVTAKTSVAASSPEALERGEFRVFVQTITGTSAGSLLARFLHTDPELEARTRAALRLEEEHDPDAIHAEIAHVPQGLSGNVASRPTLRGYEIPVMGGSGITADRQIPVADLLVSVRGGRVQLRSRSHGKRVVPHLTCAHNFGGGGMRVYRFLAFLQAQGLMAGYDWTWGPLSSAPFLPRVTHGRLVFSLAQWRIGGARLRAIDVLGGGARFRAVQGLRAELRLPRYVRLVDSDNTLPLDFDNVLSVDVLLAAAKRAQTITLSEIFPGSPADLVARGSEGAFHHEMIVPFVRAPVRSAPPARVSVVRPLEATPEWSKRPGGDWLYVKAYCGVAGLDRILRDAVAPLVRDLRADAAIDRWFFLRYSDPEWHLRLRIHGEAGPLWRDVAPRVLGALSAVRGAVHKVVVDTYEPEVERYGGPAGITLAEEIFEADSDAAIAIAERYAGNAEARWHLALVGMDAMLTDLGLTLEQRRNVMDDARAGQARRYSQGVRMKRQMGDKFRTLRPELEGLLTQPPERLALGVAAIRRRSVAMSKLAPRLLGLDQRGQLTTSALDLAASHLHMWANRVFRGSANAQELVLYELLYRVYDGRIARLASASKTHGRDVAAERAS